MNDIVVLIYTYKNNFYKIKYLKDSWIGKLKEKNIPYYFITGDNFDIDEPYLKIDFSESYEQLPLKTYLALEKSLTVDYKHVVKTDDDIFLNVDKLIGLDLTNIDYLGKENYPNNLKDTHFYKCKDTEYHLPKLETKYAYAEGGFYILSRKSVEIIVNTPKEVFFNKPSLYRGEDVLVGEILLQNNINLVDYKDNMGSNVKMDITREGLSIHPVHFTLLSKINNLQFKDQINILKSNPYLNDYIKKDIFDGIKKQ